MPTLSLPTRTKHVSNVYVCGSLEFGVTAELAVTGLDFVLLRSARQLLERVDTGRVPALRNHSQYT